MGLWVGPLLLVIAAVALTVPSLLIRKKAQAEQIIKGHDDSEFRVNWLVKTMLWAEVAMSLWIITMGFGNEPLVVCLFFAIGVGLLTIGLLALYFCQKSRVVFQDDEFVYCNGVTEKRIDLKGIKNVWIVNGMIVIDEGIVPRTTVLHIFKNNSSILSRLQAIVQDNLARGN